MIRNFLTEHLTGKRFADIANVQINSTYNDSCQKMITRADIVYIKTDYVQRCFNEMWRREKPCVLITHNSDYPIHEAAWNYKPDSVKKWYATNVEFEHEDLISIPLGCENVRSPGYSGNMMVIDRLIRKSTERRCLCYMNMNPDTHPVRKHLVKQFGQKQWVRYDKYGVPFEECMKRIHDSKFVMCPPGNGIDTHRFAEALYLGAYPIVLRCTHYENMDDLPFLMVDDYEEVTQDLLDRTYKRFQKVDWDYNKLKKTYWLKRIREL